MIPHYQTPGSAGCDICSAEEYNLIPGESKVLKTGLMMAIPEGYEAQVRPRSGLAAKHGVTVLNTPGTIDSDYRNEVGVILINHGKKDFHINIGERIGQFVFAEYVQADFEKVESLDETERKGGFGHTGT